jgi:hypothetical protein
MKVWPGGQKLPTRQLANPLRKNASLFHRYDEGPKWAPTDMLCKPPGNAIFQGRDKDPETVPAIQSADCRDKMRAQIAASSGRFALNREIPVCAGLRGGAERTRTWNQTPCTSNMEKGLDFGRKRSVSVAAIYGPLGPTWIAPRRRCRHRGASVVTALDAVATERIPNVAEQTLRES